MDERHVEIVNYEKVREQVASGHSVMVYMGHKGGVDPPGALKLKTWRLRPCMSDISVDCKICTDMLMLKLREKYGAAFLWL